MQKDDILTRDEVAEFLRVTRGFLDHLSIRGDGPRFFRVGRAIRYYRADVTRWLEAQTYTPPSKKAA